MVWRQLRDRTRLRFSAALPLGINRNERHSKADWNYPNNRQPLPYFFYLGGANAGEVSQFSTRSGVLRAYRGQASGSRDSASRRNSAHSSLLSCSPPAVNATSHNELQSAARCGGELCAAQRAARARPKSEPYAPPVAARKPKARRTNFHTHHNPLPVPIKIVLVEAPSLDEHKIYTYI